MKNISKTEEKIRESIIKQMKLMPFYKIKVSEIAEMAGINRSTFYAHHDSILEALEQIEVDSIPDWDGFMHNFSAPLSEQAIQMVKNWESPNVAKAYETFSVLLGPHGNPDFRASVAKRMTKNLYDIAKRRGCSEDKSHQFSVFAAHGMLATALCFFNPEQVHLVQSVEQRYQLLDHLLKHFL